MYCSTCGGSGWHYTKGGTDASFCMDCNPDGNNPPGFSSGETCDECLGSGRIWTGGSDRRCPVCDGHGKV